MFFLSQSSMSKNHLSQSMPQIASTAARVVWLDISEAKFVIFFHAAEEHNILFEKTVLLEKHYQINPPQGGRAGRV